MDANIFIAALIKNSVTSDLLVEDTIRLYTPEFLLEEFEKYKEEILEKTHRSPENYKNFLEILMRRIEFIPREELDPFLAEAENISPDPKDTIYFAIALRIGARIWSNDKRFHDQKRVRIISTTELWHFFRMIRDIPDESSP
ncbi:MAG TPA: PIN domain-containing protein [Candidatus Lokiarchaeia archaeon]|nr:PIN domain-containing protein [Candidatus Lokiarchaeia archaeon]